MASSRQHQEAHGIGQIEQQLKQQAEAAEEIQGESELDREISDAHERFKAEDPLENE
ncbi:hypothetical protein AB6A23_26135 [Paenibacillus tarimensis]